MEEIVRYRARISGPLLDRIDMHLELPSLEFSQLAGGGEGEGSGVIRERVNGARRIQTDRFRDDPGVTCNAHMGAALLRKHCALGAGPRGLLKQAVETLGLSGRAFDRVLKVARTLADLDLSVPIRDQHVAEALHYRSLDRDVRTYA